MGFDSWQCDRCGEFHSVARDYDALRAEVAKLRKRNVNQKGDIEALDAANKRLHAEVAKLRRAVG